MVKEGRHYLICLGFEFLLPCRIIAPHAPENVSAPHAPKTYPHPRSSLASWRTCECSWHKTLASRFNSKSSTAPGPKWLVPSYCTLSCKQAPPPELCCIASLCQPHLHPPPTEGCIVLFGFAFGLSMAFRSRVPGGERLKAYSHPSFPPSSAAFPSTPHAHFSSRHLPSCFWLYCLLPCLWQLPDSSVQQESINSNRLFYFVDPLALDFWLGTLLDALGYFLIRSLDCSFVDYVTDCRSSVRLF